MRSSVSLSLGVVLLAAMAGGASAAEVEEGDADKISGKSAKSVGGLGAVVDGVEVVRAEEILVETEMLAPAEVYLDTPVETEVFTAEDLRLLPGANAIDALDAIPGLRIQSQVQGQRGAVRIDGLPPEFTEILVNGQRYSGENGEAIDLGDVLFANIDRIEVLRGPQALRYSARAAGGVINFITKDAPTKGIRVSGEGAAGDQEQGLFETTVAWGTEDLGLTLTYDFNQIAGFNSPNSSSSDPDDGLASPFGKGSLYRTHDLYTTLEARPSDLVTLKTRLGYRLRDEGFAIDQGPIESRRETERWLLSQDARVVVSDLTELYGTLTYSRETLDTTVGRDFELVDELARLEAGLVHSRELGPTFHLLTVGVDVGSIGIELVERSIPDTIDNDDLLLADVDERFARAGAFAILESEWASALSSEIGLRYEMRDGFKPTLLPQAALLLRPWQWDEVRSIKIRFSAGRAVRYPALRELFQPPAAQNGGGYFLAGSEDLGPERAWAFRLGIEANPKRWISGSIVGFYNRTKDRIRAFQNGQTISVGTTVVPANPVLCGLGQLEFCSDQIIDLTRNVFQSQNLDDFESYGIEARVEFRPWQWMELSLGYTWNRNVVSDSNVAVDELPNSPRHIANGRLRLTAPVTDTVFTARGQWRDRAIIEGSGTGLLSFAIEAESNTSFDLDFRILQPLEAYVGHPVDVFADLQNVTDNRVIDSNVVRGRSFLMGLKWNLE